MKIKPQDAESIIIAALFHRHTAPHEQSEILCKLNTSDFENPVYRSIIRKSQKLDHNGDTISRPTLNADEQEDAAITSASTAFGVYASMRKDAVAVLLERRKEQNAIRILNRANAELANAERDEPADTVITSAINDLIALSGTNGSRWTDAVTAVTDAFSELEARSKGELKPIPTGFKALDTILNGGFRKSELTVIGARPAVGKSAVSLAMAINAADNGFKVLYVSLEMSQNQIGVRIMARESGINSSRINSISPTINNDNTFGRIADSFPIIGQYGHDLKILDDNGGLTVEQLRVDIQTAVRKDACDIVFIDYLQLLNVQSVKSTANETERVTKISRALKLIAKNCNVPVIALAQLNRDNDRDRRPPVLSDLRSSGSIEQDADNVILLHRPEPADIEKRIREDFRPYLSKILSENFPYSYLELIVGKHRQGRIGRAETFADYATTTFYDLDAVLKMLNKR